jgi:hypothetical protein
MKCGVRNPGPSLRQTQQRLKKQFSQLDSTRGEYTNHYTTNMVM